MNAPAPRIDVHAHIGGVGACGSGITVSRRFRRGIVFAAILRELRVRPHEMERADDLYLERMATMVRESGAFDRAVALAMDGVWRDGVLDRERSPLVVPNDWAREAARRHPELLYGASVSPLRPDALHELERCAGDGAVLVKWLPNVQHVDPGDPAHRPFYRKLASLRLPLLCHAGAEFSLPGGRQDLGDPLRLRAALDEGVSVIVAHCGTLARCRDEGGAIDGVALLGRWTEQYPNLWADLSAMTSFLRGWSLRRVLDDERLRPRLLDASDFPVPPFTITALGRAPLREMWAASRERNLWAKDRALKRAQGWTDDLARRAAGLLRLPAGAGSGTP